MTLRTLTRCRSRVSIAWEHAGHRGHSSISPRDKWSGVRDSLWMDLCFDASMSNMTTRSRRGQATVVLRVGLPKKHGQNEQETCGNKVMACLQYSTDGKYRECTCCSMIELSMHHAWAGWFQTLCVHKPQVWPSVGNTSGFSPDVMHPRLTKPDDDEEQFVGQ